MFSKWQKTGASHEVTIVLFSRVYYEVIYTTGCFNDYTLTSFLLGHNLVSISRSYEGLFTTRLCWQVNIVIIVHHFCLFKHTLLITLKGLSNKMGHNGTNILFSRCYEDFYRVVVQNEKFDDWFPTLTLLRQTLVDYPKLIKTYHARPGITIPTATLSTAAQGNFLEVLNISLNTFEKHFINRNLDRTGQQAIVITPGVGIFEVITVCCKQNGTSPLWLPCIYQGKPCRCLVFP